MELLNEVCHFLYELEFILKNILRRRGMNTVPVLVSEKTRTYPSHDDLLGT